MAGIRSERGIGEKCEEFEAASAQQDAFAERGGYLEGCAVVLEVLYRGRRHDGRPHDLFGLWGFQVRVI